MAITKEKKQAIVDDLSKLLGSSKLTVAAKYQGLSVSDIQQLRRDARDNSTVIKVTKNRLFKLAVEKTSRLKGVDLDELQGQLLYAFNEEDEVTPAQVLATFKKNHPQLEFVGAITSDGNFLSEQDVVHLASLPSKDQLRAQLIGTIGAPLSGFANVLAGNVRGVLNVLQARSEQIA